MTALVRDLVDHQLWADALLWTAIGARDSARDDSSVRTRLHHIHLVQRLFTWAIGDRSSQPAITSADDFPSFDDLLGYARQAHEDVRRTVGSMTDARLGESISIPWVKDPPLSLSVSEALVQMTTHSHYHRGQNATRLRELGGEPPITDFIFWLWKGKPQTSVIR